MGSYAFPQMHRFKPTCFAGRALWQTPGVRGLWVKDGDLHPGEIIEVCSSPQASEGHGEWEDLIGHFWGGPRPPRKVGMMTERSSHTLSFPFGVPHFKLLQVWQCVCSLFLAGKNMKKYYHPMKMAKRHRQNVTRRARSQKNASLWSRSSAGDEGDFVLVRKDNGIEGWTKVKNLSSAALPLDCVRRSIPEVLKAPANWVRYISSSQHGPCWSFQILLQSLVRES